MAQGRNGFRKKNLHLLSWGHTWRRWGRGRCATWPEYGIEWQKCTTLKDKKVMSEDSLRRQISRRKGGINTDCSVGTETRKVPQTPFSAFVNHNEGNIQSTQTR
jgi:hypothetical protein